MIDVMYANNDINQKNFFYRRYRKSGLGMMGSQPAVFTGMMWERDIACLPGRSKLMPTAMASDSWMVKNKDWSGRVEKIRGLVISGRYKIDAERLAEKMLGSMAGVLIVS